MLLLNLFTVFATIVACVAEITSPSPDLKCGRIPRVIFDCIGNTKIVSEEITSQCHNYRITECERLNCIFEKANFLTNGEIDVRKVAAHFDRYGAEHPEWKDAIRHARQHCFRRHLPAQGIHTNCPAYDIVHCSMISFLRNVKPSRWLSSPKCEYPRRYAAACPICPDACFDHNVPQDACHACEQTHERLNHTFT